MIKIIEGSYVGTRSEFDLDDILSKVDRGYVLIYAKDKDGTFHEGYLFFENGKLIGAYYTDNKGTEKFGDRSFITELLTKNNKVIEIYRYDKDKLNLMRWLYPEIFKLKLIKDKFEGKYSNETLTLPTDTPIAKNVDNIESYLQENKYILVNIYSKDNTENAYIVYYGETPIAAYYECEKGSLFGNDAYEKIKELLETDRENYIVDIYSFDKIKLNVILETYPKLKLEKNESEDNIISEEVISEDIGEKKVEEETKEEEELSREELLKRLGIKEPDEEWVEEVINELFSPDEEDLKEICENIKRDIINKLKEIDGIKDVNVDIKVDWKNGRYFISGEVDIKRKRILGIFKKDINLSMVKLTVDKIIRNNIPKNEKFTSSISIKID